MRRICGSTLAVLILDVALAISARAYFDFQTTQLPKHGDLEPVQFENERLHPEDKRILERIIVDDFIGAGVRGGNENRPADEQAIRRTLSAFSDARNAFDSQTIAHLFAPDGEFTTPIGTTYQGRPAIQKFFATLFQSPEMKTSRRTRTVRRLRFLGPDFTIAEVTTELSTGAGTIRILEVCIMTRLSDDWLITSIYHMHLIEDHSVVNPTKK